MPKTKKPQSASSESDSDSGPEDRTPPPKKAKTGRGDGGGGGGARSAVKNADGDYEWQLEGKKAVKVREFKGKIYVDIREYYEKDGKLLPGKKGISLTVPQWKKMTEIATEVDEVIKEVA